MTTYAPSSGVAITKARVSNFRSLVNVEIDLNDLTVLIGANNAGKTSFLDAVFGALGAGRRNIGQDDIRLAQGEASAPKSRIVCIDLKIQPIGSTGEVLDAFPGGSFWTALWGTGITIDETDEKECAAIRTMLAWSDSRAEYVLERRFLKEWRDIEDWISSPAQDRQITASQLEPIAFHYVDAKRDLEDDLRRPGSFWRRMTDDLGLTNEDTTALELALSGVNETIVGKSEILKHLKTNLADLQNVVSADSAGIEVSPVARKLRDLSKGVDVSFTTSGAQSFPLARHGMGTRSLAALLVFRAFASWRHKQATQGGDSVHSILGLEEPESHLHPQAQRALFGHIKSISGQRIVSTHSPYFAGQAQLEDLRLFIKSGGDTSVKRLDLSLLENADDKRKLQDTVIDSRGDILFCRALVLFEGQTEELSLPIWAERYWGVSIHELGFSFARANGCDYFPFILLAKGLGIPWYVIADAEPNPKKQLEDALAKAGEPNSDNCSNVIVLDAGKNFETQLMGEGYAPEVEAALIKMSGSAQYVDEYIDQLHGMNAKGGVVRDYKSPGGRERAILDALSQSKTSSAKHLANIISSLAVAHRRFPSKIRSLLEIIGSRHNLQKAPD